MEPNQRSEMARGNVRRPSRQRGARDVRARADRRTRVERAQGRETRDELLTAALRVFARRGYAQAGVDEIAAEAGYSKGALYWHFSSKEELLLVLLKERIDQPMRQLVGLLESARPEVDMPFEGVSGFKRQLREQREALLLEREHWSLALRDPEHRERYVERQTELRCAVAAAIEAQMRELGKPDLAMPAEEVARILTSIIGGLTADELIEPKSIRPELFGEALALIHGGLVAQLGPQTGVADHRWRDSGKS